MRIAITGASGFVGSHTVAAALAAGHRVRVVVRDPARLELALGPLGIDRSEVEVAVADVTDPDGIGSALDGVEGVVHAASIYSFDPRRSAEIEATAAAGARNVLGIALDRGVDPVVHVSSVVALLRSGAPGGSIGPSSPPGDSRFAYARSKARQEAVAQDLQATGAPVTIVNPGAVWGPHDPHGGESVALARNVLAGKLPFVPRHALPIVDVRDLAQVLTRTLEPGHGPRRFMAGGYRVPMATLVRLVSEAAGRRRRVTTVPDSAARVFGAVGSAARRVAGIDLGATREAVWVLLRDADVDDEPTVDQLGVGFRPTEETVADQVRWMLDSERDAVSSGAARPEEA